MGLGGSGAGAADAEVRAASWRAAAGAALVVLAASLWTGRMATGPAFAAALLGLASLWRGAGGRPFERRPTPALFLALLSAYLLTFRWHGGDDAPNSLLPFCVLRHGTLALDPVLDPWFSGKAGDFVVPAGGRTLSVFPVVPGLLALPLYVPQALSGAALTEQALHGLSKLAGALLTAASAAALLRALRGRCSPRFALGLAFLYGLGSWAFSVSSQALWQHGPAALGLALGLWGLNEDGARADALAGSGFALAAAARPDNAFFAAAAGVFVLLFARRRLPGFAAGAALVLGPLAGYWLWATGRLAPPESVVQARAFRGFQDAAPLGLLASPTRGLAWFFPPALFAPLAARRGRALERLLLAACAAQALFFCFYANWLGGYTFGTRYFASTALALCWCAAPLEPWLAAAPARARAWGLAAGAALLVHAEGAFLKWPGSDQWDVERAQLWRWDLHPLADALTGAGALKSLPLAGRLAVLAAGLAAAWAAAAAWRRSAGGSSAGT